MIINRKYFPFIIKNSSKTSFLKIFLTKNKFKRFFNSKKDEKKNKQNNKSIKRYFGKEDQEKQNKKIPELYFEARGCSIGHPNKKNGGEDSFFISKFSIGVADGVGGWSRVKGGDPGRYARELMRYSKESIESSQNNPIDVLQYAYQKTDKSILGSSTAVIGILSSNCFSNPQKIKNSRNIKSNSNTQKSNQRKKAFFIAANLGDSGFKVIRNKKIILSSIEQTHGFNFPFQIGKNSSDKPSDADLYEIEVEKDDIIIMATDGIFDNIFEREILEKIIEYQKESNQKELNQKELNQKELNQKESNQKELNQNQFSSNQKELNQKELNQKELNQKELNQKEFWGEKLSKDLANLAIEYGKNPNYISPFSVNALRNGYFYKGGKLDDSTIIIAQLKELI
ncbi:protein phosphatase ptc7 [Anaeramoeba ignava]|uniref:Protein phosphatase n=1 Tax=Anaeramoeba ignava TaxID=1746090 RepID=A0A9Q0LBK1_ANAIG|nr:protein phosphatase ptc7 [Anaeramoeba ignava]